MGLSSTLLTMMLLSVWLPNIAAPKMPTVPYAAVATPAAAAAAGRGADECIAAVQPVEAVQLFGRGHAPAEAYAFWNDPPVADSSADSNILACLPAAAPSAEAPPGGPGGVGL